MSGLLWCKQIYLMCLNLLLVEPTNSAEQLPRLLGLSVIDAVAEVEDDVPFVPVEFGVRRWFRNFSSRRHLARRFENQTCILASGSPIFPANRSRAKTSG